jgi:hypothetical protein
LVARKSPPNFLALIRFGTRIKKVPQFDATMGKCSLAPAGLSLICYTKITQRKGNTLLTTIGTASLTITGDPEAPAIEVPLGEEADLHMTSLMLVANTSNWRKVAKDLIGDEPVTYQERSKKDTLRKRPIINIFSTDPDALKRVLTKGAEVE